MARLQTYGKPRKRHIAHSFDFSSPDQDHSKSRTAEEVTEVANDLKKLDLTGVNTHGEQCHQQVEHTVLSSRDVNTSTRKELHRPSKDVQSILSSEEDRNFRSSSRDSSCTEGSISCNYIGTRINHKARDEEPQDPQERQFHHGESENKDDEKENLPGYITKDSMKDEASNQHPRSLGRSKIRNVKSKKPPRRSHTKRNSHVPLDQSLLTARSRTNIDAKNITPNVVPLTSHADEVLSFSDFASSLSTFRLSKITEASYSEVYRLTPCTSPSHPTTDAVLKLIPLKPPNKRPGFRTDFMSHPASVLAEVTLLRLLSPIPGFTLFRSLRLLRGAPPARFIEAYAEHRERRSEELRAAGCGEEEVEREFGFPDPRFGEGEDEGKIEKDPEGASGGWYGEDQWWAMLEMEDAGRDLEAWRVGDMFAVWDVFWGVAIAVGKGEASVGFEHRDLHAGNVCVRVQDDNEEVEEGMEKMGAQRYLRGKEDVNLDRKLSFTGLEVTVIDYTNSRAELPEAEANRWKVDRVAYKNLEEELDVFETKPKFGYQYRIPRYMRDLVLKDGNPEAESLSSEIKKRRVMKQEKPTWGEYHPKTNLLWLHFLLSELMGWTKEVREKTREKRATYGGNGNRKKLSGERNEDDYRRVLKEYDLERKILKVESMLMPQCLLKSHLSSVADLVEVAWRAGWLNRDDILK